MTFECDGCFADTKGIKWKLGVCEIQGIFLLCMTLMVLDEANAARSKDNKGETASYRCHLRLGHIGYGGLSDMVKKNYETGITIKSKN